MRWLVSYGYDRTIFVYAANSVQAMQAAYDIVKVPVNYAIADYGGGVMGDTYSDDKFALDQYKKD